LTEREALNVHAEVLALQAQLGLSYKDAAHRLYMAEVEKLRAERKAIESSRQIRQRIDRLITNEIGPVLAKIDKMDNDL
jgi:hypothetical protein